MKKVIFSLAALVIAAASFGQKKASDVAKFESESIELGKIKQGNPTTAKFLVTNVGTEPLIIEQANPTCGCTISDYTKAPIAPGKSGYINATYNAAGVGHFDKHLTVKFAGVDELKSITISGDVMAAEAVPAPGAVSDPALVKAVPATPVTAKPVDAVTVPVKATNRKTTKKMAKKPVSSSKK
jgi:Protein of unknown function (DUF1573)